MSFIPIITGQGRGSWKPTSRCRIYIQAGKAQVVFTFTRLVIEPLGWGNRDRMLISFGTGDDFGKVLINRIGSGLGGLKLCSVGRNYFRVAVVVPHVVGSMTREQILAAFPTAENCEHEIRDGQLLITVPLVKSDARPKLVEVA
jgi:hypothetical protein